MGTGHRQGSPGCKNAGSDAVRRELPVCGMPHLTPLASLKGSLMGLGESEGPLCLTEKTLN